MTSIYEQAVFAQQQQLYGPSFATSVSRIAPPSTTSAFMRFITNTMSFWNKFFTHTIPDMFKPPLTPIKLIVRLLVGFCLIMVVVWLVNILKKISNPSTEGFASKTDIRSSLNKAELRVNQLSGSEGFQQKESVKNKLLNLQPMTAKQAAFLGPLQNGAFDADKGIANQLNLGIRSFFFQIDYLTKQTDKTNQPTPYEPVLLYRDNSGNLTSIHSYASLEDTFSKLREYGFNDRVTNHTDPIIIYLHFVRTPDLYNETDMYVKYVKKVATSLNVLNDKFAKDYYRASKESDIFNQDIHTFDGKILVGTNLDTSYSYQMYQQNKILLLEDLDYKINFRYYKESTNPIDATAIVQQSMKPNAIIVKAMDLLNMSDQQRNDWIGTHKGVFVLVKDEPNNFLNPVQVSILLDTFGVNVVPYDYINSSLNDAKQVKKLFGSSWKLKNDFFII